MKVLIVDDEKPARDLLKMYLGDMQGIEIAGEAANGFEAIKAIGDVKPDLILLDIQMPKLTGFEMLELLDDPPPVIFTTAYDEYALKAFEINAVDYLMKPFDQERLEDAIDKFRERKQSQPALTRLQAYHDTQKKELDKVVVKKGRKVRILPLDDIVYVQSDDDYVMIHTTDERFLKARTMRYFETRLPANFIRIHRSHIININYLGEVEPYKKDTVCVKLTTGVVLNASKSGTASLRSVLRQ
ncbi:MAG TPA: response regulator [Bacteroidales bacterium]|nr:response regulator [Bacteroidales bacterium]